MPDEIPIRPTLDPPRLNLPLTRSYRFSQALRRIIGMNWPSWNAPPCRFRLETTFVSGLRQSAGWRGSLTSYGWPSFTKRGRCGRCSAWRRDTDSRLTLW